MRAFNFSLIAVLSSVAVTCASPLANGRRQTGVGLDGGIGGSMSAVVASVLPSASSASVPKPPPSNAFDKRAPTVANYRRQSSIPSLSMPSLPEPSLSGPIPSASFPIPSASFPIPSLSVPVPSGSPSLSFPVPSESSSLSVPVPSGGPSLSLPVPSEGPSLSLPVPSDGPSLSVPGPSESLPAPSQSGGPES